MPNPTIAMSIRVPPELHERLRALAATNRRSANAEILVRLEESAASDGVATSTCSGAAALTVRPDQGAPG